MTRTAFATGLIGASLLAVLAGSGAVAQMPPTPPAATSPATAATPPAPQPDLPVDVIRADPAFDALVKPGVKPTVLLTIEGLRGEGPLWYRGKLYVSDQRGGNVYAIDGKTGAYKAVSTGAGGKIDLAQRYNMGPNGHVPYKGGETLIMRQDVRDVSILHADGSFTPLLTGYQGKRFNAPNDMVFGADGTLWFTDPTFSAPVPLRELPYAAVWRYRNGELTPAITDMNLPNGIGLSPDGRTLYVDNSGPERYIRAYDVGKDGALANMRMFARFDPAVTARGAADGMKVDAKGNVWVTGPGGVWVYNPQGKLLGRIQLPQPVTNVAFGGADLQTLYFTMGPTVFQMPVGVKGQVPLYAGK
jgi:gluconolactonase